MRTHVRFGSKADIGLMPVDVRFPPKSGHLSMQPIVYNCSFVKMKNPREAGQINESKEALDGGATAAAIYARHRFDKSDGGSGP
jgi:hypothetical protein